MISFFPSNGVACVLIADDLTGACDAAVHFAAREAITEVSLTGEVSPASVLAFSTESRDASESEIEDRLQSVASRVLPLRPQLIFKKIDSTLRGQVGFEIGAALRIFSCDLAVITPAFPALGRMVKAGYLSVHDSPSFEPVHVSTRLQERGLEECAHYPVDILDTSLPNECRFLSFDAGSEQDLAEIASRALRLNRRVLWAGSGGLADALARELYGQEKRHETQASDAGPVIFCIGSDHAVTQRQQEKLIANRAITFVSADTAEPASIANALDREEHVVLRVNRGETEKSRLRGLLAGFAQRTAGLFLCGGDTASLVLQSLGAEYIQLRNEIVPGVPYGAVSGGIFDRKTVCTKSGGFGNDDTLIQVADFSHARATR
jgi:uncharacterized protein YgbK (DUF1537 family)